MDPIITELLQTLKHIEKTAAGAQEVDVVPMSAALDKIELAAIRGIKRIREYMAALPEAEAQRAIAETVKAEEVNHAA